MKLYALKHIATGEFMPEVKDRRGYSNWTPGKGDFHWAYKGSIRFFFHEASANVARAQWARGIRKTHYDHHGVDTTTIEDAGRKRQELKVVSFTVTEDEP